MRFQGFFKVFETPVNACARYICGHSAMEYRPKYRTMLLLLFLVVALAIVSVIWYYHGKLEEIDREIKKLNEAYH